MPMNGVLADDEPLRNGVIVHAGRDQRRSISASRGVRRFLSWAPEDFAAAAVNLALREDYAGRVVLPCGARLDCRIAAASMYMPIKPRTAQAPTAQRREWLNALIPSIVAPHAASTRSGSFSV